jgi:hypothetical protein
VAACPARTSPAARQPGYILTVSKQQVLLTRSE